MKFRTDFVTNSSSSSFVTLDVTSKTLAEIIAKYEELIEEDCCGHVNISGDSVNIYFDEQYAEIPSSKETIINGLLSAFGAEFYTEDEYETEDELLEAICDYTQFPDLVTEIYKEREKILEDLEDMEMISGDVGWQGDSESRYDIDNYDEDTLRMYYEEIAEENGCDVEDVTEEDFCEWVSDKVSTEENRFYYSKKNDEIEFSHSFTVE